MSDFSNQFDLRLAAKLKSVSDHNMWQQQSVMEIASHLDDELGGGHSKSTRIAIEMLSTAEAALAEAMRRSIVQKGATPPADVSALPGFADAFRQHGPQILANMVRDTIAGARAKTRNAEQEKKFGVPEYQRGPRVGEVGADGRVYPVAR